MGTPATAGNIGIGGGLNTFVPTFSEATGLIQTEFTRNVKSFALNRYTKLVPVTQTSGYYLKINSDEAVRVVDKADFRWAYGEDRPTGVTNDFQFVKFTTERYERGFPLPYETVKLAAWDVVAQHARSRATQMMTLRTYRALEVLTNAGNWTADTNYFADFDTLTGSTGGAYSTSQGIQKLVQTAVERVMINTGGAVQMSDMVMVISPKTAFNMSQDTELQDLIKYLGGVNFVQGTGQFSRYGLAPSLFGIGDIVVEDAVRVSSQKGAARSADYILPENAVLFVSRPQGLVGVEGGSNFATITNFTYEDMTVETFDDPVNRRTRGSVVDNSVFELTAPLSGLYVADIST